MHTGGLFYPLGLIAGFITGFVLVLVAPTRIREAVGYSAALVFVLALIGWFSVQLAILAALIAALAAWAGAALGTAFKRKRGT